MDDWEAKMCEVLRKGRQAGRRDSIVVVAEGALDRQGNPITSQYVKEILEDRLGEDTRVTVLGHVQRGGSPSAFDRNLSTLLGADAVHALLAHEGEQEPLVVGIQGNKLTRTPLSECLSQTWAVAEAIAAQDYGRALKLRGGSFGESFQMVRTLVRSLPRSPQAGKRSLRIGIMHGGGPAPGMNTAVRAAARLAIDNGHKAIGIRNGFRGLLKGRIEEFDWMSVNGWAPRGGADLGTNRYVPSGRDFYTIARNLEEWDIEGLLIVGGLSGYKAILELYQKRDHYPAFNIPMIALPTTINNNVPGTELSVGADTALNTIIHAVDQIKQSAVASRRAFIVEVMGHYCGYLALLSAMASGAERVYIHEEGVTLHQLAEDVEDLITGFRSGKRLGLVIRNEKANEIYSTSFMAALFEEEGGDLFDVRTAILGHMQQGGNPTPFDRILATKFASRCIQFLEEQIGKDEYRSAVIGQIGGHIVFTDLHDISRQMEWLYGRPKKQWWMGLREIARVMAKPDPKSPSPVEAP